MRVSTDIETRLMRHPRAVAMAARGLLRAVVHANQILMYLYQFPALYESGVRFRAEPNQGNGEEDFATCDQVLKRGWGDCDDLGPYRCAELRGTLGLDELVPRALQKGEPADIMVHWRPELKLYHVKVRRAPSRDFPDGFIEDPSRYLGM